MNWFTPSSKNPGNDPRTGWQQPISISGQGKADQASYYAGGLVYLADMFGREPGSVETEPVRKSFGPVAGHLGQSART